MLRSHIKVMILELDRNDYLKLENDNNVFIIGDSFAEGYGSHYDEIFSELLQRTQQKKVLILVHRVILGLSILFSL